MSLGRRWARPIGFASGLLSAAVLASCGSTAGSSAGGGGAPAASANAAAAAGTSAPAATQETPFCAEAARYWSARPEVAPSTTPSTTKQQGVADAERFLASAPDEIKSDLSPLVELYRSESNGASPARSAIAEALARYEKVAAYAATHCPAGAPYFACATPMQLFEGVGGFDPSGRNVTTTQKAYEGASPEDAAARAPAAVGSRTELSRTASEVVFVWKDDSGRVTQRMIVTRTGSGWSVGPRTACRR